MEFVSLVTTRPERGQGQFPTRHPFESGLPMLDGSDREIRLQFWLGCSGPT